jgi:sec-independent protein translocase protein TatA
MPWQNLSGWHAIIILVVILLLFGAAKLPALARSVGQSMKIFKSEIKSGQDDEQTAEPVQRDASASGQAPAPGSSETRSKP